MRDLWQARHGGVHASPALPNFGPTPSPRPLKKQKQSRPFRKLRTQRTSAASNGALKKKKLTSWMRIQAMLKVRILRAIEKTPRGSVGLSFYEEDSPGPTTKPRGKKTKADARDEINRNNKHM